MKNWLEQFTGGKRKIDGLPLHQQVEHMIEQEEEQTRIAETLTESEFLNAVETFTEHFKARMSDLIQGLKEQYHLLDDQPAEFQMVINTILGMFHVLNETLFKGTGVVYYDPSEQSAFIEVGPRASFSHSDFWIKASFDTQKQELTLKHGNKEKSVLASTDENNITFSFKWWRRHNWQDRIKKRIMEICEHTYDMSLRDSYTEEMANQSQKVLAEKEKGFAETIARNQELITLFSAFDTQPGTQLFLKFITDRGLHQTLKKYLKVMYTPKSPPLPYAFKINVFHHSRDTVEVVCQAQLEGTTSKKFNIQLKPGRALIIDNGFSPEEFIQQLELEIEEERLS